MNRQLDIARFHALLWDESTENNFIVELRKLVQIKDPEHIIKALGSGIGVWSGWRL